MRTAGFQAKAEDPVAGFILSSRKLNQSFSQLKSHNESFSSHNSTKLVIKNGSRIPLISSPYRPDTPIYSIPSRKTRLTVNAQRLAIEQGNVGGAVLRFAAVDGLIVGDVGDDVEF